MGLFGGSKTTVNQTVDTRVGVEVGVNPDIVVVDNIDLSPIENLISTLTGAEANTRTQLVAGQQEAAAQTLSALEKLQSTLTQGASTAYGVLRDDVKRFALVLAGLFLLSKVVK